MQAVFKRVHSSTNLLDLGLGLVLGGVGGVLFLAAEAAAAPATFQSCNPQLRY